MYVIFIFIIFTITICILLCLGKPLPKTISHDGLIILFYKLSSQIIGMKFYRKHLNDPDKKKKIAMLYPAGNIEEQLKIYEIKKWSTSILLIFLGSIISLIFTLSILTKSPIINDTLIKRNDYGKGSKDITLDIFADGELIMQDEPLNVSERLYSQEETDILFFELEEKVDKYVLGKNKSFEFVIYDLSFPESIEDYPVTIEWELSNYQIMNRYGEILTDNATQTGTPITITAKMNYKTYQHEYLINAVVYAKPKNTEESFYERVKDELIQYEKASNEYPDCILPSKIDGKTLSYKSEYKDESWIILLLFLLFSIVIYKAHDQDFDKNIQKRDKQMLIDYPKIISKLSLLISAGMTIQNAFQKITSEYLSHRKGKELRYAYEEMLITIREIQSGISDSDALIRFGNRCRLQKYVKLSVLLSQNIKKGSNGLIMALSTEEKVAFEERKSMARKLGEEAGTKLLVPMIMMLGIVMIIVIVPAFLSFSF